MDRIRLTFLLLMIIIIRISGGFSVFCSVVELWGRVLLSQTAVVNYTYSRAYIDLLLISDKQPGRKFGHLNGFLHQNGSRITRSL